MATYVVSFRATALVDSDSLEDAKRAWEDYSERDYEVDSEGDYIITKYDDGDESSPPRDTQRINNCQALDAVAALLNSEDWSSDHLNAVADMVRATGRTIADVS